MKGTHLYFLKTYYVVIIILHWLVSITKKQFLEFTKFLIFCSKVILMGRIFNICDE